SEHLNALARQRYKTDAEDRERRQVKNWLRQWVGRGYSRSILDEYNRKFKEQKGLCAICKQKSDRRLSLDHCHVTKMLRALLCHLCNIGLGMFRDDPGLLRSAAEYLEHWREVHRTQGGFGPVNAERARPEQSGRHVASNSPRVSSAA